jgi:hypothetical protein
MSMYDTLGTLLEAKVELELAQSKTDEGRAELAEITPLLSTQEEIITSARNLTRNITKNLEEVQGDLAGLMAIFNLGGRNVQNIHTHSTAAHTALEEADKLAGTACNSIVGMLGERSCINQLLSATSITRTDGATRTTKSEEAAREFEATHGEIERILKTVTEASTFITAVSDALPAMSLDTDSGKENSHTTCDNAATAFKSTLAIVNDQIAVL